MEFIVEKVGMSRVVGTRGHAVTLLKLKDSKVCTAPINGEALVAYNGSKKINKAIEGQQKKYNLSKEYNKFMTLKVGSSEAGDVDYTSLNGAKKVKITIKTKGRGFSGVMKRWNFAGGPKTHGSRFHRIPGSIGNCEFPGRVIKGRKMPGQYGNTNVTVSSDVVSFDKENMILVLKGSVPGPNGRLGRVRIVK